MISKKYFANLNRVPEEKGFMIGSVVKLLDPTRIRVESELKIDKRGK